MGGARDFILTVNVLVNTHNRWEKGLCVSLVKQLRRSTGGCYSTVWGCLMKVSYQTTLPKIV